MDDDDAEGTAFLATAKRAKWADGTREMYEQKSRHLARVLGEDTKASRIERVQRIQERHPFRGGMVVQ